MTIFRNFGTKNNLFIKVMEIYVFIPNLENLFNNGFSWILEEDLPKIFKAFYDSIKQNHMLVFIKLTKPDPSMLEKDHEITKIMEKLPKEIRDWAKKYFTQMKERDLIKGDPLLISTNFCSGIFGLFFSYEIGKIYADIEFDCLSKNFLEIYINGIEQG